MNILDEDSAVQADTTPPTISGAADRPSNADGWYNAPVTITFTATDNASGVASVTAPVTLAGEGRNQSAMGTATDNAGNTASTTVSGINIDLTKPATAGSTDRGTGANGDSVVTLTAGDNLSGVKSTFFRVDSGAQQTYSGPFTLSGAALIPLHSQAWTSPETSRTRSR